MEAKEVAAAAELGVEVVLVLGMVLAVALAGRPVEEALVDKVVVEVVEAVQVEVVALALEVVRAPVTVAVVVELLLVKIGRVQQALLNQRFLLEYGVNGCYVKLSGSCVVG